MKSSENRYVNKTTINRTQMSKSHHKKSISSHIFRNSDLDFIDIGLLTWILSSGKNYIINKCYIQKRSGISENKFKKSWKKLQTLGYIEKRPIQGGVEWIINEIPVG